MALAVAVSQVLAGQGRLWVAVHVEPGEFTKTGAPPAAPGRAANGDGEAPPVETGGAS
jgi:hypothetical protein